VELLKEKALLPADLTRQIDDIVFPLDEELDRPTSYVAASLRKKGRSVDLVQDKHLKWVFKHAERINASRLILVGKYEWKRGMVRVKILSTREETEVKAGELQPLISLKVLLTNITHLFFVYIVFHCYSSLWNTCKLSFL
jgi:histidyl-tRNA synthetase